MGVINSKSESKKTVVLVGYQDQGNLGLGYLAAVLQNNSYTVKIIDFKIGDQAILNFINQYKPVVVGFSLIFQYFLPQLSRIISLLRANNINCHFTVGGHYPSLRYEEILTEIPDLDSVVLFEGEYTLLELVGYIANDEDWKHTQGIAYRHNKKFIKTALRPLLSNLDQLPYPHRPFDNKKILGKVMVPIIATRGCHHNCCFCSIREFYGNANGRLIRRRSPTLVVKEMKALYLEKGATIFLFQDDDFPLTGKGGRRWIYDFINALDNNQLLGKVIWKISCRVDEIDLKLFSDMKAAGLYLVYLGIESGTDEGLKALNKGTTVANNLNAVAMLKELDLMFGYGFMLFDPESTFESVLQNANFLRQIVGDGSAPVIFCKMLPYAGTPIEKQLAADGRLTGSLAQPDYDFFSPELNDFHHYIEHTLDAWVQGNDSVSNHLNAAWHEVSVLRSLFPGTKGLRSYESFLRKTTKLINERILNEIEISAESFIHGTELKSVPNIMRREASQQIESLLENRDQFIFKNQTYLLEKLACA